MKRFGLTIILLTALFLMGCGGSRDDVPATVEITIELREYRFGPEEIELYVGQEVTFILVNIGRNPHEFSIGREVAYTDEDRPNGYNDNFFDSGNALPDVTGGMDISDDPRHGGHGGFSVVVDEKETAEIKFVVTEEMQGRWELGCFWLDGIHYQSGMVGSLVVRP